MKNGKRMGKDRDREKICMYGNMCVWMYDKKEGERKLIIFRNANIRESRIKQNTEYIFYSNKKIKDKKNPKQHKKNNHIKLVFYVKKFLFLYKKDRL